MTAQAQRHASADAVADFLFAPIDRSAVAMRTIREAGERYGWEIVWLAAVSITFRADAEPRQVLPLLEAACERLGVPA